MVNQGSCGPSPCWSRQTHCHRTSRPSSKNSAKRWILGSHPSLQVLSVYKVARESNGCTESSVTPIHILINQLTLTKGAQYQMKLKDPHPRICLSPVDKENDCMTSNLSEEEKGSPAATSLPTGLNQDCLSKKMELSSVATQSS
ncbi:hypothetical protein L6164_021417 [Bauhinia variegata]|uniref:Uncharacterized protein n=1 Tax=Bauhinia variegata TaxID=167791 RepID=A0ACB9MZT0_BAUVA|nr:hypothetical protein L6164_021417 [Bauhinia variegata]